MKTFISILSAKTNSYSNEKVVIGLLAITAQKMHFGFAEEKLSLFSKFFDHQNPSSLLKKVLEQIKVAVDEQNSVNPAAKMSLSTSLYNEEYFDYLKKYSNGLLQFSETLEIPKLFTTEDFESYFKNFVGSDLKTKPIIKKRNIHSTVKAYFKKEGLTEKADVDFNLHPTDFKGILKSTKIPLITKNGNVNAIQVIDFKTQPNSITGHLYETKIIQESLVKFLEPKKIALNKIQIAFDEPEVNTPQHSIFDMAYKEYKKEFDFIESEKIDSITSEILNSNNTKFSGLFQNH
jgi:hypothetical protein